MKQVEGTQQSQQETGRSEILLRFGRYQLDLTQPPPPLNYDIQIITSKKKSADFVASEAQKKVKAKPKWRWYYHLV